MKSNEELLTIQTFSFIELHFEFTNESASNLSDLNTFRVSSSLVPASLELLFTGTPLDRDDIFEAMSKPRSKDREVRAVISSQVRDLLIESKA